MNITQPNTAPTPCSPASLVKKKYLSDEVLGVLVKAQAEDAPRR